MYDACCLSLDPSSDVQHPCKSQELSSIPALWGGWRGGSLGLDVTLEHRATEDDT